MRLPPPSAHFSQPVRYGRYVARRLRRGRHTALAADVENATRQLRLRGRELEDADDPVQDALADRDATDDDLDVLAQDVRHKLAGRSVEAAQKAPYKHIFPDGIGYYTAAPLDEEKKRYGELKSRLIEHLAADDAVRLEAIPAIEAGLVAFASATSALDAARTAEALAATRLDAARDAWSRLMEKIYGLLVSEVGKTAAERFFPRVRGSSKNKKKKGDAPA